MRGDWKCMTDRMHYLEKSDQLEGLGNGGPNQRQINFNQFAITKKKTQVKFTANGKDNTSENVSIPKK